MKRTTKIPNSDTTDKELIEEVRRGSLSAFEFLYQRYSIKMYRQAYAILNNEEEAKDLTQELFLNFWNKIKDIKLDSDSIFAYLYTANKNLVFKKLERAKLHKKHQEYLQNSFEELDFATIDQMNYSELKGKLDQAIALFPSKMKAIFELSRNEHLSHKEIAEKLNISDKTVKKQINNAIKLLKNELNIPSTMSIILLLILMQ
ncbi:RNA polymerase sigma factor [Sphingobacterium sp. BIGb0165]|uniref:RNA polymerase sigma factor n=1 Tax=Sphingobacterium sp. BIGb0165 TaxID=2940615 RepID=UPI002168157D|nr:RNA polymerase sigma-70 factor [Sphingobacterium sp. BIGb0165]MCS4224651.1 RNA polymerase sigma-70 factor (ECF subfamily) [Sphingobacterium sp. BIGb0165]